MINQSGLKFPCFEQRAGLGTLEAELLNDSANFHK